VDLKSERLTYSIDERALTQARLMDGKFLLVANDAQPVTGHSAFSQSQAELRSALPIKKLAPDAQLPPL
jgi:hypothetical protein